MGAGRKENSSLSGFCRSTGSQIEIKESEKIEKYLDLARGLKKSVEHEGDGDTNYS